MCVPVQVKRQQVKNNPGTFRRRDGINVIEVGQQTLVRTQLAAHLGERRVLTQGEQSRHQRVALFAAFRLRNQVGLAVSVMPHKPGGVRVELVHKRQAHIGAGSAGQGLQHGLSADGIKCADAIDGQDGCGRTGLSGNKEGVGHGRKLKRLARVQEPCCKALSQGASHQTPQEVTNHDPSDACIGFLKGDHAPQAKCRCDARWGSRLSQGGGSTNKRGTQRQTAELRSVTGGAGSSSFPSPPQIAKEAVSTTSGWKAKIAGSMESCGWLGLRPGSCNSARVGGVSGAKGPETNRAARSARRAGSAGAAGGGASVAAGTHAAADPSSASHRPAWKSKSRARHSGLVSLAVTTKESMLESARSPCQAWRS